MLTSGRAVEHRALDRHPVETFGVVTLEKVERVAPLKANPTSSDPVLRPHPDLGDGEVTRRDERSWGVSCRVDYHQGS